MKRSRIFRRSVSVILSAVMLIGTLATAAYAAEAEMTADDIWTLVKGAVHENVNVSDCTMTADAVRFGKVKRFILAEMDQKLILDVDDAEISGSGDSYTLTFDDKSVTSGCAVFDIRLKDNKIYNIVVSGAEVETEDDYCCYDGSYCVPGSFEPDGTLEYPWQAGASEADNITVFILDNWLYVDGNGAMRDYKTPEERPWDGKIGTVEDMSISDEITRIGSNAFVGLGTETEYGVFSFGSYDSVLEEIGASAFEGANICDIELFSDIKKIESRAFADSAMEYISFYTKKPDFIAEDAFVGVEANAYVTSGVEWNDADKLGYGGKLTYLNMYTFEYTGYCGGEETCSGSAYVHEGKALRDDLSYPDDMLKFDHWEVVSGEVKGADPYSAALDFVPTCNVVLKVYYVEGEGSSGGSERSIVRLSGDNRYETACEISKYGWDLAETVVIASGENYPDALAGAVYAKTLDAPILLTGSKSLNDATLAEIERLGAQNAVILGGTAAISESAAEALSGNGISVTRVSGDNRNATAAKISEKLGSSDSAFLVSNANYADALSASSAAAITGSPILYVNPDGTLPKETAEALDDLGCRSAVIVGGEAAIGKGADEALEQLGITTERIFGSDRYATSFAVYEKFNDIFTSDDMAVATGKNYPDALAGAAFAARDNMPVLLASDGGNANLSSLFNSISGSLYVFGGENAVSDDAARAVLEAPTEDEYYRMGVDYYFGTNGRAYNPVLALKYLDAAGISADSLYYKGRACEALGYPDTAIFYYEKAAEEGSNLALVALGCLYSSGDERTDDKAAKEYADKALANDCTEGYIVYGNMYQSGSGVEQDKARAIDYFNLAAAGSDTEWTAYANASIGSIYEDAGQYDKAYEYYNTAAEAGQPQAAAQISTLYFNHGIPAELTFEQAMENYRYAAEHGCCDAYCNMAKVYTNGLGTEPDPAMGARYYRLAAANNSAKGAASLAVMYMRGIGVERDLDTAEYYVSRCEEISGEDDATAVVLRSLLEAYAASASDAASGSDM